MKMNKTTMLCLLAAGAAAYYIWNQHRATTVLDRRYPMAYTS
jgi:hypothetical protein